MNLILLCVSSIFLARFLEKRMRVASIAHAVLFIVISFAFLFNSGFALVDRAMINLFGEEDFNLVHESLVANEHLFAGSISGLLIIETITFISISIVAIIGLIKGFKKLLEKFSPGFKFNLDSTETTYVHSFESVLHNHQFRYLILKHLRN